MVMSDIASYGSVSVSADGRSLVATKTEVRAGLWVAPLDDLTKAVQIGHDSYASDGGNALAWTPSGELIYNSAAGDQHDLWIADKTGGQPRRLTNDPIVELNAAVSPDGQTIVFLDSPGGQAESKAIWRVGTDGGGRKLLVPSTDKGVFHPLVTADGRSVVYYSDKGTYSFLGRAYRVPIEGGTPEPLGAGDPVKLKRFEGFLALALSPDGRMLAGLSRDGLKLYLTVLPLDGSRPPAKLASLEGIWAEMDFAPDGRSLIYHDYHDTIWSKALDGSPPQKLVNLEGKQLYNLAVWNQGRRIAYSAGSESRDVVLIQETKGE
jgi:Tol biopolymer transport system component